MNLSYHPRCTNRYVWHRLVSFFVRRELSTLLLTLEASTLPKHGNKPGLESPTTLPNLRKTINYIPPLFKHGSNFPPTKSISASVVNMTMWTDQQAQSSGGKECGGCQVGHLAGHCSTTQWAWRGCRRTCWVREEEQGGEPLHHGRLPVCVVPSAPYIASPIVPISPQLVFHPCPSGHNGVPGWLDGWRCPCYWQPLLDCHSFLSRSPKTWVIAVHRTLGKCSPFSRVSFIFPVVFLQFLTPFFSPFISVSSPPLSLHTPDCLLFFPLVPFSRAFSPSFSALQNGPTRPLSLRNLTRFDRLYQKQQGGLESSFHKHTHIHMRTHTQRYTHTLSFSVLLARWTLLLEMLASSGNYLAGVLIHHQIPQHAATTHMENI